MSTALLHVTRCRPLIAQPLAYESLAHPSGLALSPTGGALYVTEMMTNRVLRFVQVITPNFPRFRINSPRFRINSPTGVQPITRGARSHLAVAVGAAPRHPA